ncbi:MAG: hypothetical protein ACTHKB_00730 [Burkholderiaceae bacterium]
MMVDAECVDCGFTFRRDESEHWKTVCIPCFKERKRRESEEYEARRKKVNEDFARQRANSEHFRRAEPPPFRGPPPAIPAEMLKRLIMLCHPDKHGGSEMSRKATQWLLEQRDR